MYLKNYNKYKIMIDNLTDEIKEIEQKLDYEPTASVARYNDNIASTNKELTSVEAVTAQRESYILEIKQLEYRLNSIAMIIRKIDRAMTGLTKIDKNIIVKYYLEEYTWREIAQQYCYSLSWIKKRAIQAIKQLSDMIFGIDVDILLI